MATDPYTQELLDNADRLIKRSNTGKSAYMDKLIHNQEIEEMKIKLDITVSDVRKVRRNVNRKINRGFRMI